MPVGYNLNMFLVFYVVQEKLKEKKPTSTEALSQALQAMHKSGCLNLTDIVEGTIYIYIISELHIHVYI